MVWLRRLFARWLMDDRDGSGNGARGSARFVYDALAEHHWTTTRTLVPTLQRLQMRCYFQRWSNRQQGKREALKQELPNSQQPYLSGNLP
jgi:hypothetical protein